MIRKYIFHASPRKAIYETLILNIVLWLILLVLHFSLSPSRSQIALFLSINALSILPCTARLQLPRGTRLQQLRTELAFLARLNIFLAMLTLIFSLLFIRLYPSTLSNNLGKIIAIPLSSFLIATIAFLCTRLILFIIVFWNHLRRRHLFWAITHAQMMVVALGAALLIVIVEVIIFFSYPSHSLIMLIPTTIGLLFLSMIGLAAIVIPFAFFSYFVIRRATQRVKTLALATSMLRGGKYAIRVPIEGEDEVAQLQTNFNAMASDMQQAMSALQNERDTVASLLQERRELIANVSHELRTPVAVVRGYLETTLAHWDDCSISMPTLHHDIQVMEDEIIRLQMQVEDLFALSRAEVGKLTLRCEPTDVGYILQHIVEVNAPLTWRSSKIEVLAEIAPILPLALIDEIRLQQVLQNLLHNAIRHTSPGGIVALEARADGDCVLIEVKDTGEGIAPEDLPHIWDRFYQADKTRNKGNAGTGLGLALVKEWVEGMGGTVAVSSVLNEGSCFSLRLPQANTL